MPLGSEQQLQRPTLSLLPQGTANRQILCVDDDPENLQAMRTLLHSWQCSAVLKADVDSTLNYAKTHGAPDFIVMDYQLNHDCDGLTLIQTLREIWQQPIAAVLLTAVNDDQLKAQCSQAKVGFLSKPVKPAKLKALLKRV